METSELKDCRMQAIIVLYDMHTDYFIKAVEGISDEDASNRLDTPANHVAWIAGSIVESRYEGARGQGLEVTQSGHELFKNWQGIQDATYPALAQYIADWKTISPLLRQKTIEADSAWLDKRFEMEGMEMSNWDMVTFQTYREANMIGQIALWRRLLGYPALNYM